MIVLRFSNSHRTSQYHTFCYPAVHICFYFLYSVLDSMTFKIPSNGNMSFEIPSTSTSPGQNIINKLLNWVLKHSLSFLPALLAVILHGILEHSFKSWLWSMSGCRQPSRSTQRQNATQQWFSKSGPGSAASLSAGNHLDMQILRSTLDLWNLRFWEWGPAFSVWTSFPDNCDACWSMSVILVREKSSRFKIEGLGFFH